MIANRDSWIVKWAYSHPVNLPKLLNDGGSWELVSIPHRTTLCALFWRALVVGTVSNLVGLVAYIAVSPVVALVLWVRIVLEFPTTKRLNAVISDGLDRLEQRLRNRRYRHRDIQPGTDERAGSLGLIAAWLRLKKKVCPLIEIK